MNHSFPLLFFLVFHWKVPWESGALEHQQLLLLGLGRWYRSLSSHSCMAPSSMKPSGVQGEVVAREIGTNSPCTGPQRSAFELAETTSARHTDTSAWQVPPFSSTARIAAHNEHVADRRSYYARRLLVRSCTASSLFGVCWHRCERNKLVDKHVGCLMLEQRVVGRRHACCRVDGDRLLLLEGSTLGQQCVYGCAYNAYGREHPSFDCCDENFIQGGLELWTPGGSVVTSGRRETWRILT